MRERESSAAAACCALPVCCMLCAVSCSTAALSHCTYALFILCSSIFSTLLQAPVNCWTDFFSFLPCGFVTFSWLPKSKSIFSVCVGGSFRRTVPLSVQERKVRGYTSRSPLLSRSRWKMEGGPSGPTLKHFLTEFSITSFRISSSFFGFLKFWKCLCSSL